MDAYEATSIVFSRIQTMDPENASRIMGYLLIHDHGEKEMIRLAFGPENLLHSVILKARNELGLSSNASCASPTSPFLARQSSSVSSSPRVFNGTAGFRVPPPALTIPNPSMDGLHKTITTTSSGFCSGTDLMDESVFPPYAGGYGDGDGGWSALPHRRSCSLSDICFGGNGGGGEDVAAGFGWKPCLYYARGYCKNGNSCRFLHGGDFDSAAAGVGSPGNRLDLVDQSELLSPNCAQRQRLASLANSFPYSPTKGVSFLQQNDAHRFMMMGEDLQKFGRSRMEIVTPSSRQIYLTFPADSTFREEDVSNYFSIFGPVQDVRIPYQQKRMFGFVTFVYPETVKLILAKGNPHFVCDSRVLVKPYKEKGKVPDKYRKQQQQNVDRVEFSSACTTPTGLDSRDPLDLHLGGARGFYNSQDILWRKKLEEQADLQQALEIQGRRLMSLQLLDVKTAFHGANLPPGPPLKSPAGHSPSIFSPQSRIPPSDQVPHENCSNPTKLGTETDSTVSDQNGSGKGSTPREESDLQESFEHNLPDSPFASPTKPASVGESALVFSEAAVKAEMSMPAPSPASATTDPNIASSLLLASSALDMASLKSCYFPMPRFSSTQETIEM